MSIDERSRLQLAEALKRALGDDEGITLMELLPPVGWADVATKHDLLMLEGRMDSRFESLEARMDARFERGFRQILVTITSLTVSGFIAVIAAVTAALIAR
jgi:hypothetical protein